MSNALNKVPAAVNEPVRAYAPGTSEHTNLIDTYKKMYNQEPIDVPMYIGGKEVRTNNKMPMNPPHEHGKVLGHFNYGDASHVNDAIDAAMAAKKDWANLPWEHRAAIFLKAADLLAGPFRDKMNASTMLAQSKNVFQAEIDAACELIDFFKFNVQYITQIYSEQPDSLPGMWNRLDYRPLEGFVFAITPFNFTSICANLCAAPAMMGNTIVWKPAETQMYSAQVIMELFKAAGLPDGVINLVTVDGPVAGDVVFKHRDFGGLHFTGSTGVFRHLWKEIGNNIGNYKSYPRVVGETGGKDFIMVHKSSDPAQVATAITRGSFEFQGQKCSASSRAYVPNNIWDDVKSIIIEQVNSFKIGSPEDTSNFINAVIDEKSFDNIASYIDFVKKQDDAEIIIGGGYDKSVGYFIEPTVVVTTNPKFRTLCEEIFGPVMTIYVYEQDDFDTTLDLVDSTSDYALTGSIISNDRYAIDHAMKKLEYAAGNFYINDKPTGAVVGQQPFGGARGSGTNDKAGSPMNLLRWVSPRTTKETFIPASDYRYPFLG
ncbi:MAG: L-glutamate gamma-semialdehyde dehydrogenase [Crocinitomicaceae bacterium]|nr:L-glutamate gamma-semialdehyde dehydrogenase [Crocinitomicaceae bacterium]MDC0100059.1 L-glutamate gamma-semialdehyde dehydrogenase [Crocinitomicaceae bacterium]MDC1196142.1 L-glutamate gamma-semialdehyde dehydrogenase [Crocinitomicaceae bacterium]MDC1384463.1 L-glutamate gamma-semialdehyde dehydrogenase [Crocinitomicaceae bacterium]|tara:strand:+ start:348 stop:1976 length:1629 start_codon:yes stop_codon:yes gene_type:complete